MTCIIIEDQPPAQRILKKFIADLGTLQLAGTFPDALQALDFLRSQPVDLIFLDIHLPKVSGLDFLQMMPHPPQVILTTAFPDYALASYEFNVVDYLLKPFSFQRFVKAVAKVQARSAPPPPPVPPGPERREIFLKSGHEHIKIDLAEVLFIKSDADYTELHLPGKKHLSTEPLRHWLDTLPEDQYVRVHKSFIVNIGKIEKVAGRQVYLNGSQVVPIGRAYKEDFVRRFLR